MDKLPIVDIAVEIFVSKGLKKLKAVDDVPVITLEALQNAEPEYIIVSVEAGENFVKYADDVTENFAKYMDEMKWVSAATGGVGGAENLDIIKKS